METTTPCFVASQACRHPMRKVDSACTRAFTQDTVTRPETTNHVKSLIDAQALESTIAGLEGVKSETAKPCFFEFKTFWSQARQALQSGPRVHRG